MKKDARCNEKKTAKNSISGTKNISKFENLTLFVALLHNVVCNFFEEKL